MNRKDKYQEKLNQVMNYKELLENALPKHIEIATYSFPIEPETDEYGKPIKVVSKISNKMTPINYDYCCYLAKFIINFFQNTNKSAIEELEKLKDDYIEYNFKPKEFIIENIDDFTIGQIVIHPKFGKGTIKKIENDMLHVTFEKTNSLKIINFHAFINENKE